MRLPGRAKQHPIVRASFALRVGRWKLYQIVGLYTIATLILGLIAGIALHFSRTDGGGINKSLRDGFGSVLNPGDIIKVEEALPFVVAGTIASILGIILPVLLLGSFVFKLFYQDPVVWRKFLSVEDRLAKSPVLRLRFYNGTISPLANLSIRAFARIRSTGTPRYVKNALLKVVDGETGEVKEAGYWAFSRPGVPFTVSIPLSEGLTARQTAEEEYIFLTGQPEAIKKDRVTLLVLITGITLGNGFPFYSAHEYDLNKSLLVGHYGEIEVFYEQKPQTWKGWENFEQNSEIYVFGYASLSSPSSVEATLGHAVEANKFCYAKLQGWTRSWCVGSDKRSHPERTFFMSNGMEYKGLTVFLGIEPNPYGECDGAVFPVSRSDLSFLDVRERNYERIDVSQHVTWAGKPKYCTVYTYVPLEEARARVVEATSSGREVNIRSGYIMMVQDAFDEIGQGGQCREWTTPPYKVEDLHIQVDPSLAASKMAIGYSSYLHSPTTSSDDLELIVHLQEKGLLTPEESDKAKSRLSSDGGAA